MNNHFAHQKSVPENTCILLMLPGMGWAGPLCTPPSNPPTALSEAKHVG